MSKKTFTIGLNKLVCIYEITHQGFSMFKLLLLTFQDTEKSAYNRVKVKTNEQGNSLASCRAMIVYFSKLAKTKDEDETIDLNFVDSLLQSGANINFPGFLIS